MDDHSKSILAKYLLELDESEYDDKFQNSTCDDVCDDKYLQKFYGNTKTSDVKSTSDYSIKLSILSS